MNTRINDPDDILRDKVQHLEKLSSNRYSDYKAPKIKNNDKSYELPVMNIPELELMADTLKNGIRKLKLHFDTW